MQIRKAEEITNKDAREIRFFFTFSHFFITIYLNLKDRIQSAVISIFCFKSTFYHAHSSYAKVMNKLFIYLLYIITL